MFAPSLRAQFSAEGEPINQLHGSADQDEAERELAFFFPKQRTLAVIKPDAVEEHRGPRRSPLVSTPRDCTELDK